MFHRKPRRTPFQRETDEKLEQMRDDCIALFIDSGLTQKQIHERGGPTPSTISKWLYGETHFPRYATIDAFLRALGAEMVVMNAAAAAAWRSKSLADRLALQVSFARRPKMPPKHNRRAA